MTYYYSNDPATNAALLARIEALTPLDVSGLRRSSLSAKVAATAYGIPSTLIELLRSPAVSPAITWAKTTDADGVEHYTAIGSS